jgi:hypothetical protein
MVVFPPMEHCCILKLAYTKQNNRESAHLRNMYLSCKCESISQTEAIFLGLANKQTSNYDRSYHSYLKAHAYCTFIFPAISVDINECSQSVTKCGEGQRCENYPGTYRCYCNSPGTYLVGGNCEGRQDSMFVCIIQHFK